MRALATITILLLSLPTHAAVCQKVKYEKGNIIEIKSALRMGGRIQLPANLITAPVVSNNHLWDVEGLEGTNQIVLKPNSELPEGADTMIYAFTDDGNTIDIHARRSDSKGNQPCVIVDATNAFFNDQQKRSIQGFGIQRNQPAVQFVDDRRIKELEKELASLQETSELERNKAVVDALRKYRFRIYTRYSWDEGKEFVGNNTVADVYDDGQFTYIRLANPNRGILSVETVIGGKDAIAPTKYDDAYGVYKVTGIYPKFTMRIDNVTIEVKRRDNATKGNI
ncbi:TPA: TrbG/VirB9 family P-type conjugative transfer protein [Vibrio cholerae]|uniref:TrbG/VirB9 family P-type conjugative transfer protein n=1 Tax=Vibrio cholerae TaxID=666 RepID=UPI001AE2DF34|nr:TrbG/VirB9 family P-type conjugative transfer protein [Vibrio cholerae]